MPLPKHTEFIHPIQIFLAFQEKGVKKSILDFQDEQGQASFWYGMLSLIQIQKKFKLTLFTIDFLGKMTFVDSDETTLLDPFLISTVNFSFPW